MRIADQAVVSVPNFGHWKVRWALLSRGRMPETGALPEPWWSTPNIHLCTLRDFVGLCDLLDLRIDACASLVGGKPARAIDPRAPIENWRAETALFLLSRKAEPAPAVAPPQNLFGEVELPKAEASAPKRKARVR
jgi:methionine biosynthesis protein MetW